MCEKLTIRCKIELSAHNPCIQNIPVIITDCLVGIVVTDLHSALHVCSTIPQLNFTICATYEKPIA